MVRWLEAAMGSARTSFQVLVGFVFVLNVGCSSNGSITSLLTQIAEDPSTTTPAPSLVCDSTIISGYGGGSGTSTNPYRICALSQWNYLAGSSADWTRSFKLEADLDFTGVPLSSFQMVGTATTPFSGSFDGGGYKIKNLTLTGTTESFALFKKTDGTVSISNLTLENITLSSGPRVMPLILDHGTTGSLTISGIVLKNISITSTNTSGGTDYVGSLVGRSDAPTSFSNITATNLTFALPNNSSSHGGLAGVIVNMITVSSVNISGLSFTGASASYCGGIVGQSLSTTVVTSSFTDITITGLSLASWTYGGGIIAEAYDNLSFTRVRITGTISAGYGSGLVPSVRYNFATGFNPNVTITDSSVVANITGTGGVPAGGLVGVAPGDLTITRSYHSGLVGTWNSYAAGLVGTGASVGKILTITDSYAQGNRNSTHATNGFLSGLVGGLGTGTLNLTRVFYAGGTFTGGTTNKSCIGHATGGTVNITDAYFDSTTCAYTADYAGGMAAVVGQATALMKPATAFSVNWLSSVWSFSLGSYPTLIPQ